MRMGVSCPRQPVAGNTSCSFGGSSTGAKQESSKALSNNVAIAIRGSSQQLPLNDTKAGVYLDVAENLLLNGNPTSERARLNVGDEISTGERVFVMIRVEA